MADIQTLLNSLKNSQTTYNWINRQNIEAAEVIEGLLAVIEKNREALTRIGEIATIISLTQSIPTSAANEVFRIEVASKEALALTPNIRLVEVGYAITNLKTGKYHCTIQPDLDTANDTIRQEQERNQKYGAPTKLYTMAKVSE